jgi:ABC-type glutathione transport system ATPase component
MNARTVRTLDELAQWIHGIGYRSLPMIIVDNLSFSYERGQRRAIDNLSFAVEQGEIFGFLGPSGAGKSWNSAFNAGIKIKQLKINKQNF